MTASRVDAVIDYLVAQLPAVVGGGVHVWDGPTISGDSNYEAVYVGWEGDEEEDDAAEVEQEWRDRGRTRRSEQIEVRCCVEVSTGDSAVSGRRTRSAAILDLVRAHVDANRTLGLGDETVAQVAFGSLKQGVDEARNRVYARRLFTVSVRTAVIA